jgi:ABC-type multidrug transport system fused ATPase/permease subunit
MNQERPETLLELNYSKTTPFRTLLQIFKPERKNIIIALVVLAIKHSPALFLPIIIGNVINAIIAHGSDTFYSILLNSLFIMVLLLQNIFTHKFGSIIQTPRKLICAPIGGIWLWFLKI